jgi:hypothetical protein
MNKLAILVLGIFLVFGLVGISFSEDDKDNSNGDACTDECPPYTVGKTCYVDICIHCDKSTTGNCKKGCLESYENCGPKCEYSGSWINPSNTYGSQICTYYSESSNPKCFDITSDYTYWVNAKWITSGNCNYDSNGKCVNCGCKGYYCNAQHVNCQCDYSGSTEYDWPPWSKWQCNDCKKNVDCDDDKCAGWCMDNAPVYDGMAGCSTYSNSAWSVDYWVDYWPLEGQGYNTNKYVLNSDIHTANIDGDDINCFCNYLEINDFYQCDSSQIDDSHLCSSDNCAPDFAYGQAFCCPSGMCAHVGDENDNFEILTKKNDRKTYTGSDISVLPNLYCYVDDTEIRYRGTKLKCNNGVWEFDVDCGETIYNFHLFYDDHQVYPEGYNYRYYSIVYPFKLSENRIIRAYLSNQLGQKDSGTSIEITDSTGDIVAADKGDKVVSAKLDEGEIRFLGNDIYNLYVGCYLPNGAKCNPNNDECLPESYCTEDRIKNDGSAYCCPDKQCSYSGGCYTEGTHKINGCNRRCTDGVWTGLGEGEVCETDCDCTYHGELSDKFEEYNIKCAGVKNNQDLLCLADSTTCNNIGGKGICCDEKQCGVVDNSRNFCVDSGDTLFFKGLSGCFCEDGSWKCKNTKIKKDFSKTIFTNSKPYKEIEFDLSEFTNLNKADATIYIFFDKGNYNGNIKIKVNGNSEYNGNIKKFITINLDNINPSTTPIYNIEIETTSIDDSKYFSFLGSIFAITTTKFSKQFFM